MKFEAVDKTDHQRPALVVIHKFVKARHSGMDCRNPEYRDVLEHAWKCIMSKQPCVYILASQPNGTLYTGVTSNLVQRVYQHRTNAVDGFTKQYKVHDLV